MRSRLSFVPLLILISALGARAQPCSQRTSELVSYHRIGSPSGITPNGDSSFPSMSYDGRYVSFRSYATQLVNGPVNMPVGGNVFIRDRETGQIKVVDSNTPGFNEGFADWQQLSGDGNWVVFATPANNVIPGTTDSNGKLDIYLKDLTTGRFERVSVPDITVQEQYGITAPGNRNGEPSISADGNFIAFTSQSRHLDSTWWFHPSPEYFSDKSHIYVRDRKNKKTYIVTRGVGQKGEKMHLEGSIGKPVISGDGLTLFFLSDTWNIDGPRENPSDPNDNGMALYRAVFNGEKWVVNLRVAVSVSYADKDILAVSPNARFAAFVINQNNNFREVMVYDVQGGFIRPRGDFPITASHWAGRPALNNHGIAWEDAIDYTDGGTTGGIFYRDLTIPNAPYIRIGRHYNGTPMAPSYPGAPQVSLDGRVFAFHTLNRDVLPNYQVNDGNGKFDVYLQTNIYGTVNCPVPDLAVLDAQQFLRADGTDVVASAYDALNAMQAPGYRERVMSGIAADGTARLMLRATVPEPGTVTFTASYPALPDCTQATPVLRSLDGTTQGATLDVQTIPNGNGGHVAFAVLLAPDDFARQTALIPTTTTCPDFRSRTRALQLRASMVYADTVTRAAERGIRLERPPVMLVHGIWSKDNTWKWPAIEGGPFRVWNFDYSRTDGEEFAVNARLLAREVTNLIAEQDARNIAIAQADVIAHSMGGVLTRHWAANTFADIPTPYRSARNYMQGSVHRFVMVNSAPFGSEFADVLYDAVDADNVRGVTMRRIFALAGRCLTCGAVENLRTPANGGLTNWPVPTEIAAHAMTGDGGDQGTIPGATMLGIAAEALRLWGIDDDDIFRNCPDDSIVALYSQDANLAPGFRTPFHGENSLHTNVTKDHEGPAAHDDRAFELLNQPMAGNFANDLPAGPTTVPPCRAGDLLLRPGAGGVHIALELSITGERVAPGQQIVATIRGIGTFVPTRGFVYTSRNQTFRAAGNPLQATITIPLDATGAISIAAAASDESGTADLTAPVRLLVTSPANLAGLNIANGDAIRLDASRATAELTPVGVFADGHRREIRHGKYDSTGASRTLTFASSNPSVLKVTGSGLLIAQKPGTAIVTAVSPGGIFTNAGVIVTGASACNDGIDNDGDGAIDLADNGCQTADGITELSGLARCNDGIDNDGDGTVDLADPQCTGAAFNFEDAAPAADFSVACTGLTCNFDARLTSSITAIATYAWNFGDGTSGSGAQVSHTYAAGTVSVTLTVTDVDGQSSSFSKTVVIDVDPPAARFSFDCTGLGCNFDGSASTDDSGVVQYTWDFGDGTTGSGATVSHTYATAGSRTVTLAAYDAIARKGTASKYVVTSGDAESAPLRYQSINPCRVLDTRTQASKPANEVEYVLDVTSTPCGSPVAARAVSLSITAIEPTAQGHLKLYASGRPTNTSVVNFMTATAPRANNAIIPVSANGTITIRPYLVDAGSVHFVVDVHGFFVEQVVTAVPVTTYGFAAVAPCRFYDSRSDAAPDGTVRPFNHAEIRTLSVQGRCGVPAGAAAASLNLAALSMTTQGYLRAYASDQPTPIASVFTFKPDRTALAGGVRAPLAPAAPDLAVQAATFGGTTHVAAEVNGYFSESAPMRYYPIAPCRTLDTRSILQQPKLANGETRNVQIRGNCGVPPTARAAMLNITVLQATVTGYLTAWPSDAPKPVVATILVAPADFALANGTIVPLSNLPLDLSIFASLPPSGTADLIIDVFGYFR